MNRSPQVRWLEHFLRHTCGWGAVTAFLKGRQWVHQFHLVELPMEQGCRVGYRLAWKIDHY